MNLYFEERASHYAKENVTVYREHNTVYIIGSEIATLRLYHRFSHFGAVEAKYSAGEDEFYIQAHINIAEQALR